MKPQSDQKRGEWTLACDNATKNFWGHTKDFLRSVYYVAEPVSWAFHLLL